MKITKKLAAVGVAGVLGVTGVTVLAAPLASAVTQTEEGTAAGAISSRLQAIKDALAGLVTDGTLTQEQADEVATTLDASDALRGPGGHGRGGGGGGIDLSAAAETLGMTSEELRTALEVDDTTLADVAAAQGVETATLVDALVAASTERIETKVEEGRLTQEEADERIAALPERIAALVEQEARFGGGHGHGPRGGGRPDSGAATEDGVEDPSTEDADTAA